MIVFICFPVCQTFCFILCYGLLSITVSHACTVHLSSVQPLLSLYCSLYIIMPRLFLVHSVANNLLKLKQSCNINNNKVTFMMLQFITSHTMDCKRGVAQLSFSSFTVLSSTQFLLGKAILQLLQHA